MTELGLAGSVDMHCSWSLNVHRGCCEQRMEQPEQPDVEDTWNTEADTFMPIHSRQRAAL